MNLTLSIDDEVLEKARARAQAYGKSVNQMVREYLEGLAGHGVDRKALADRSRELSLNSPGNSKGWKWNRDEIQRYP